MGTLTVTKEGNGCKYRAILINITFMRIGSYGHVAERNRESWVLYHNPKCSKSCEVLYLLRSKGIEPKIIEYIVTPPSKAELQALLALLNVPAKELIRSNESSVKNAGIDLENTDAILNALIDHPEWLQRPILVHQDQAIIARPPERILKLLP